MGLYTVHLGQGGMGQVMTCPKIRGGNFRLFEHVKIYESHTKPSNNAKTENLKIKKNCEKSVKIVTKPSKMQNNENLKKIIKHGNSAFQWWIGLVP